MQYANTLFATVMITFVAINFALEYPEIAASTRDWLMLAALLIWPLCKAFHFTKIKVRELRSHLVKEVLTDEGAQLFRLIPKP